jgi:ATP-binding cassette, subfamily B, bacterial
MKQAISSKQRERVYRESRGKTPPGTTPSSSDNGAPASDGSPARRKPDRRKRWHYLREYFRWLWPYRFAISVLFLLALLGAGLDMVWPMAIKWIVDAISGAPAAAKGAGALPFGTGGALPATGAGARGYGINLHRLNVVGCWVIGLLLVKQLIETWRSYRTAVLNARVIFRLRRRLYNRLLRLPLGGLAEMKSGGIVSRLSGDVDSVSGLIQMALISPGVAIIRVILTVVILVFLSWRLAVAALILLPPLAAVSFLWSKRVRPIYRSMREDNSQIDGRVSETFGGIRVVRAFRREPREERGYAVGHHTIIRKSLYAERLEMILGAVWGILIPMTSLVVVWYGGWLVMRGKGSLGDIFAFQIYAVLLLQPMWQIVNSVSQTQKSLAAMERVFEVLETPRDKPDAPDAVEAPRRVDEIRFNHVTFEYRPGVPVLSDVRLVVPGGSTVALVGPSGAGKTTLTDLVARFYDPTSGSITLNGLDLRKLKLASYRSLLAVVQQETFLFDGTVRENIAYGLRGATEAAIVSAAKRANAHDFITQLPEGYDTLIGERGFKLSGGQKQRLSIARAVLADPQILILDEATSNLDTESEQLIQSALADLLRSRTTFVIAHRLSTITHADLIVVLDAGRVVETGTHEDLMDKRGLYYDMVERQRQSFGTLEDGTMADAAV